MKELTPEQYDLIQRYYPTVMDTDTNLTGFLLRVLQEIESRGNIVQVTLCLASTCSIHRIKTQKRIYCEHMDLNTALVTAIIEYIKETLL